MDITVLRTLPDDWADPVLSRVQAEALLDMPHHYLLATEEASPRGYLMLQAVPQSPADVLTVFVKPAHRRQNLGLALMRAALDMAKSKGCSDMTLEVDARNTAAIKLYSVCGLQQVGKRRGYYRDPVSNTKADAVVMAVRLT